MPRREYADSEDMMVRCPRCNGHLLVIAPTTGARIICPLCDGTGRINSVAYANYQQTQQATPPSTNAP